MILFISAIVSIIILLTSSAFLAFGKLVLLYIFLGAVISFMFLWDIPKITIGGKCEGLGVGLIKERFAILSWKKFIITWLFGSFLLIPMLFIVMMASDT